MTALRFLPYLVGVIAIWLVSSLERAPVPELLVFWHSDKLLHIGAYALLASLALFAVHSRGWGALAAVAMSALYGCIDELHQSFVPGRSSSGLDLLADLAGALLGVGVWMAVRRRHRPHREAAQPS